MEDKKKSPGRPTNYKPEYCEALIAHMKSGLSFECFGAAIGVSRDNVYEWAKVHPEFSESKELAKAASLLFWEREGVKGLWNEKDGPQLNNSVWIFNMKNRHGWKDKTEHAIETTRPIVLAYNPAGKLEPL